mgnify:CR=1 FL=1
MRETLVCVSAFVFGLPFAISLFPQEGELAVADAEDEFKSLLQMMNFKPTRAIR